MRSILSILSVLVLASGVYAQPLEECYHTLDELYEFIFDLQSDFPQFVQVDSIGHSRGDMLGHQYPVYAVKISDNVATFEDEPVNLIVAHIHAEEVAGMEATLRYMLRLVTNQDPYRTIRNQTQTYIIPTMNPDGLEVLSMGLDETWRKNGYVPPNWHVDSCLFQGVGEDRCGVDLNRNWDLNWIYGDTLWVRENVEPFDYYRGPGPFSEPESQAVRDLALRIKPTVSIVWHSSRSGNVSERCIVAWQWGLDGNAKFAPDCTAIGQVNRGYIAKTIKHPGTQPYLEVIGGTRNGALHDWFYRNLGTIQILTETSPRIDIQPTCDSLAPAPNLPGLAQSLIPPMEWLSRRLINMPNGNDMQNQGSPLKIHTRNSQTGGAISAEYRVLETWTPLLNPWYTNEEHGSATILPPPSTISVMARKEGFRSDTNIVTINPGGTTLTTTLELEPLPWYDLNITVVDESSQITPATVFIDNGFPQAYDVNGTLTLEKPLGVVHIRVEPQAANKLSRWFTFYHDHDTTVTLRVPNGNVLFSENFTGGAGNWTAAGYPNGWRVTTDTSSTNYGNCIHTNEAGYRVNYPNNLNATFTYNNPINLSAGNAFHLSFDMRGRLDFPADSFNVEASVNGTDWQEARGFSFLEKGWHRVWCDLSPWAGNSVYVRFRLKSDNLLGDMGIHFDNIEVMGGVDLDSPRQPLPYPWEYALSKVYPNPFNPTTNIAYETPSSGPVTFTIHNVLGQMIWSTVEYPQAPGHYIVRWNGTSTGGGELASGQYFLQMFARDNLVGTQKLMFLK